MNRRDVLKLSTATMLGAASSLNLSQASENAISDTTFKNIRLAQHGSVLLVTIEEPPRNTVSKLTLGELDNSLDIAAKNKAITAIVITGTAQVFSAGAGGDGLQKVEEGDSTHAEIARNVFNRIERFPKPVIAAVNGLCSNGGNELAMSCDIRIASKNAVFLQQELHVGLIPGFGGMQRLQRLVGHGRAMDIMLTARKVTSDEALNIGLITSIFSESDLITKALELGNKLGEGVNRPAFAVFKERLSTSYSEPFNVALRNDQVAFDHLAASDEAKAAIQRFIQKTNK
jgi:enoyl-CoA hydratase/carnithine racemase